MALGELKKNLNNCKRDMEYTETDIRKFSTHYLESSDGNHAAAWNNHDDIAVLFKKIGCNLIPTDFVYGDEWHDEDEDEGKDKDKDEEVEIPTGNKVGWYEEHKGLNNVGDGKDEERDDEEVSGVFTGHDLKNLDWFLDQYMTLSGNKHNNKIAKGLRSKVNHVLDGFKVSMN